MLHLTSYYNPGAFWPRGSFWQSGCRLGDGMRPLNELTKENKLKVAKIVIIEGDSDYIVPTLNSAKLRGILFESQVCTIPNSGHFPFIENPNCVINSIRESFIASS